MKPSSRGSRRPRRRTMRRTRNPRRTAPPGPRGFSRASPRCWAGGRNLRATSARSAPSRRKSRCRRRALSRRGRNPRPSAGTGSRYPRRRIWRFSNRRKPNRRNSNRRSTKNPRCRSRCVSTLRTRRTRKTRRAATLTLNPQTRGRCVTASPGGGGDARRGSRFRCTSSLAAVTHRRRLTRLTSRRRLTRLSGRTRRVAPPPRNSPGEEARRR
mmetsp:Transcript_10512/g.43543  ORF Transcript_10512/g.43543 Transcript_10512/m.43543 type:complete len:213 (-) Transcript_10512:151-789(-)